VIGNDTEVTHGRLLHLSRSGKTYFVTFATSNRIELAATERDVVFDSCLYGHSRTGCVHCCVVMPDHVHIVLTPFDSTTMRTFVGAIKSASAHQIGRPLWQRESFDHILRSDESLREKCEYVAANPVRKGLVDAASDWPWLFRAYEV